MLKRSKVVVVLLLMALVLSVANMAFAEEVPNEAVQILIDDSRDILAIYASGMSYKEWKDLYGKLVKDEARFSAKYPNSKYGSSIRGLMSGYDIVNEGWYYYVKGTNDKSSLYVIENGMKVAKFEQKNIISLVE